MADYLTWVVAAEPALGWPEGDFVRSYYRARSEAVETNIVTSTLGQWICALAVNTPFTGTATALFDLADDKLRRASDWPKNARQLSAELRRLQPALRMVGVSVEFKKEPTLTARRLVVIRLLEQAGISASAASESSEGPDPESATSEGSDAETKDRTVVLPVSDAGLVLQLIPSDASDASDAGLHDFSGVGCAVCSRNDAGNPGRRHQNFGGWLANG